MRVSDAVATRRSVRAFLPEPVPRDVIERVLDKARRSPSGGNVQPWNSIVLSGEPLAAFTLAIKARIMEQPAGGRTEYRIYPPELDGRFEQQRVELGKRMFGALKVPKGDAEAMFAARMRNIDSFGAPIQLFTYIRDYMGPPQWADLGMWLQTIMLLLREEGLDSCSQEIWSLWGHDAKELLGIADDHVLFCGMAIGYREPDHAVNNFPAPRVDLDDIVEFRGL